ncbi:MAG: AmmeMemoRadiSam system radical SAM enzyme [Pseudomonadota bacterium]
MQPDLSIDGVSANYWRALPDGRLLCEACPRACKLKDGQRGLCFVRARRGDEMVLTTYGRSSGFCVDPIEKKPLNHFLPGTAVLSFGTAGCNLACKFCQNWEISKSREVDTLADAASPEALARAALAQGCSSLAYTYNDPIIFSEYAVDCAAAARALGVKNVAVTAGYVDGRAREDLFAAMDATNVDLKAFTEEFYRKTCSGSLDVVKDTLRYLVHETSVWVEITTLLIPGSNDDPNEIDTMTRWIASELGPDVPLHFSAFRPEFRMRSTPATPHATLIRARQIALGNGLRFVYVGNVLDEGRSSTWCSSCGEKLIGRARYRLTRYAVTESGCCARCNAPVPGVFAGRPGTWGHKRKPVRLSPRPPTSPMPASEDAPAAKSANGAALGPVLSGPTSTPPSPPS